MKNVGVHNLIHTHFVHTRQPAETINELMTWVNDLGYTYSSVGIAAFGPLGLDTKQSDYGYVTSTPKLEW